jgi:cytochrome c oxidase cbb3-type subunit 1
MTAHAMSAVMSDSEAAPANGTFNYKVVRQFAVMTVVWGIVGMAVGVLIAAQLLSRTSRTAFMAVLRTPAAAAHQRGDLRVRRLGAFRHVVLLRAAHLPGAPVLRCARVVHVLGLDGGDRARRDHAAAGLHDEQGVRRARVADRHPDHAGVGLVRVVFFGTIAKRRTPHIYVANWFYGAFILTVALLHVVNSAEMPVTFWKSYSAYAGVQDAMVQWWYGHNAVGFFLTAGFLGMMYYFVPKQAGRPIYSYRLSIVHFWALIFTYMWAGPHHLHYTALPDWTQSLGMVFSLILLAPVVGRHDQRRHDAVGRVAQAARRSRSSSSSSSRCPSTAWRRSRAR